jgi:hypothetical protein
VQERGFIVTGKMDRRNDSGRAMMGYILPPHILRSIAEKGTARQRSLALRTLSTDSTFRALRTSAQGKAPVVRRRVIALAMEGEKQRTIYDAHHANASGSGCAWKAAAHRRPGGG